MSNVRMPWNAFDVQPMLDAWVVIDSNGRPMSDLLSYVDAGKLKREFDLAAFGGRDPLHRILTGEAL